MGGKCYVQNGSKVTLLPSRLKVVVQSNTINYNRTQLTMIYHCSVQKDLVKKLKVGYYRPNA